MGRGENNCQHCRDSGVEEVETLEHMLIACEKYEVERNQLIVENKQKYGEQRWNEMKNEEDRGLKHILGFTKEGKQGIENTKKYLRKIWEKRKNYQDRGVERVGQMRRDHGYA